MEVVSIMWGRCGTHGGYEYYVGQGWVLFIEVVSMMWGRCGSHGGGEYYVGEVWDPWRW